MWRVWGCVCAYVVRQHVCGVHTCVVCGVHVWYARVCGVCACVWCVCMCVVCVHVCGVSQPAVSLGPSYALLVHAAAPRTWPCAIQSAGACVYGVLVCVGVCGVLVCVVCMVGWCALVYGVCLVCLCVWCVQQLTLVLGLARFRVLVRVCMVCWRVGVCGVCLVCWRVGVCGVCLVCWCVWCAFGVLVCMVCVWCVGVLVCMVCVWNVWCGVRFVDVLCVMCVACVMLCCAYHLSPRGVARMHGCTLHALHLTMIHTI